MSNLKLNILLSILAYAISLGCSTMQEKAASASAVDCIVILPREANANPIPEKVISEEVKECLKIRDLLITKGYLVKEITLSKNSIKIQFSQAEIKNATIAEKPSEANKTESLGHAKLESEFQKLAARTYNTTPLEADKNKHLEVSGKKMQENTGGKEAKIKAVKEQKDSSSKPE